MFYSQKHPIAFEFSQNSAFGTSHPWQEASCQCLATVFVGRNRRPGKKLLYAASPFCPVTTFVRDVMEPVHRAVTEVRPYPAAHDGGVVYVTVVSNSPTMSPVCSMTFENHKTQPFEVRIRFASVDRH